MGKKKIWASLILMLLVICHSSQANAQCNCINNYVLYEDNQIWIHRHLDSTTAALWIKTDGTPINIVETVTVDYGLFKYNIGL